MKKLIFLWLSVALLVSMVGIMPAAYLGGGYTTVANDVCVIKTGLLGKKICFTDSDFKSAFCITDFNSVTINSLPSSNEGTLLLAGRRVKEGQSIKRKNVGALTFVPSNAEIREASFTFTIENSGAKTPSICKMKFVDKINYAPTTPDEKESSLSITTQAEISVFGRLEGKDPEGDKIEYIIAKYPKNGALTFVDKDNGAYKYTPTSDFTGYDSFIYVLRDEYGNYSEPQEVGIRIIERLSTVVFEDMKDRSEYNAAVAMSAMGVMNGKTLGDGSYFLPDESITRAEFVSIAMKAYGMKADSSITHTFFDDDNDIPAALISYVGTAQKLGIVKGKFGESGLVFEPNRAITKCEAAEILSALLGIGESEEEIEYFENATVSASAKTSVSAMYMLGIFDGEPSELDGAECVTRAEIAEYMYRIITNK